MKIKRLVTVNVREECYFFVFFLHWLISVMWLKYLPLAHVCVLSREWHWSMDASIVRCSMFICFMSFYHYFMSLNIAKRFFLFLITERNE